MNQTRITTEGLTNARPGREAPPGSGRPTGSADRERRRGSRRRRPAEAFRSYYGLPVLNPPVWEAREIAGYFFLGGLAGASSVVAAIAQRTGQRSVVAPAKVAAAGAVTLSLAALVKDLGRPTRALNMLRVLKPTSPMSVGTWVLSCYAPAAIGAAGSELTGLLPAVGATATGVAAALGPAVASYTAVLISDTAVPAWHDARREMPAVFVSSAASAAAGVGLLACRDSDAIPLRRLAIGSAAAEIVAEQVMERRLDPAVAKAYHEPKPEKLLRASRTLSAFGAAVALLAGHHRVGRRVAGTALIAASALTRFGIFHAGMASARDPEATIGPQRARLAS
ncbi:MAG TPA: NrfD/PsrC family molybdoenzyme membrane anchor subunit [Mycobacteriales bacterium]|nr:NrfD/PsrC family molybdoenzyme membrane anchor subunit [Mycobacteriales bacterium]